MEVSSLQNENALSPIATTLFGIAVPLHPTINVFVAVSIMALQFSLESYMGLLASITMVVSL